MKKIAIILTVLVGFIMLSLASSFYYFTFTDKGSLRLVDLFMENFVKSETRTIGKIQGNLWEGVTLKNVEISNWNDLPQKNLVKIQSITIKLIFPNFYNSQIKVENARIYLRTSDPIIISASFKNRQLKANVFSSALYVPEIVHFFDKKNALKISGLLKNIDVAIDGPLKKLQVHGGFLIEELQYEQARLVDSPATFYINVKKRWGSYKPKGQLVLERGELEIKNINFYVNKSNFRFHDDFDNLELYAKAHTKIHNTKIFISLTGTKKKPSLKLTSEPSLSEEKLLVMMATGVSWNSWGEAFDQRRITPDLTKELIDYYLFASKGKQLAQKLGIKDVSILYNETEKGLGVRKQVTENLDLGYQIKKSETGTNHTIGGEVNLTNEVSVSVEKELEQNQFEKQINKDATTDDKIMLKYKKVF